MRPMISIRHTGPLFLALLVTLAVSAQQGTPPQPAAGLPPLPPPRGSLSVSAETAAAVAAAVKAPAGFTVTAFAAPPVANYPACLTATHDGVVFVCVDRNGSLQTDSGMGYIARLVDRDQDGRADEYTVFAALDSPRGVVFDGETLYVSHPPLVTALRDRDGDGIAEERRTLVRGLGFGLDFRGADHTTNGIELGIDGWLYVAVGDYGFVKATGADGQEIQLRGGGNVRVRPDGTELEIYSRGTRNDYDLAIDPYLNLFARGNTNDGGGFDIRMYHFVPGATYGYPTLFRNFSDEVVPPIADYGTGSGTGMLYVHDAGLPRPYGDALYSVDWGRNAVFRHLLTPKGATFEVDQEEFVAVPRPTDLAIDGSSRLYLASWDGGQFRYAGENVGYIARLTHDGAKPAPPVDLSAATDATLAEAIGSANLVSSRAAQAAMLRRGRTAERMTLLERRAATGPLHGRVAAIFTLKQLAGAEASPTLTKLASDPAVRAFAIRALADRRGEIPDTAKPLFVRALGDANPRVQLEAIAALRRMGATDAAAAMLPLTTHGEATIANVAINALAALSAVDAPLAAVKGTSDSTAAGALRVLQQIHQPAVVSGLIGALAETSMPARRTAIIQSLARLYNREGVWRGTLGEWWGTRPDTTGPYYDPVAWEESPRIRTVLIDAFLETAAGARPEADASRPAADLQRNRVLPPGGAELLTAMAAHRAPALAEAARVLVGRVRLDVDGPAGELLAGLSRTDPRYRAPIARMVVAAGPPSPGAAALLHSAATDASLDPELRASAFTALAGMAGADALRRSIDVFSAVVAPTLEPPLDVAWTQFISMPSHAANVAVFRDVAESADASRQRLAFAVLLQLGADPPAPGRGVRGGGQPAGGGRGANPQDAANAPGAGGRAGAAAAPGGRAGGGGGRGRGGVSPEVAERARAEARAAIDAAWNGPAAASLIWAVGRTGAVRYRDRVESLASSPAADVREAAAYASSRLPAATAATAAAAGPAAALVAAVAYDDLVPRLATVTGDAALGRKLFDQQACGACHTTAAGQPEKGPPLGGIATRYSRAELIESIVRPAAKVAQGFATNWFTTTDKRQLAGFVVREGQEDVVIRDLAGTETTIRKSEIAGRGVNEGSTMPPGLVDTLTLHDLASLLAFLESTSAQ
jgi:putative membrane-bound dehydrogenase-like protein